MMFSERLEHSKYVLQHLQGTVRVQKPVQFRVFSAKSTVFAVMLDQFLVGLEKIFFSDLSTAELKNVKNKGIRP